VAVGGKQVVKNGAVKRKREVRQRGPSRHLETGDRFMEQLTKWQLEIAGIIDKNLPLEYRGSQPVRLPSKLIKEIN